jgi:epoxyqueuosine reductase
MDMIVNKMLIYRGSVSDMDGKEGNTISPEEEIDTSDQPKLNNRSVQYTKAVADDKRAPDLQFSFRIAAYICGMGEIGWSKMFLTPEFGPMQRFAFILTDAPLVADKLYSGPPLCKKCMACVRECPGSCISATESVSIMIGDKKVEWGAIDEWKCYAFYTHTGRYQNPFVPKEVFDENKDGMLDLLEGKVKADEAEVIKVNTALEEYFPSWLGYNMVKCGGCLQACINQLEKGSGCLNGTFKQPLRTRKRWTLDR